MGIFHCPFGCPFYDDIDCIDCGMCLATNEAEMVEASKKIRAYLKAHANKKSGAAKKITVCGKGGVGKSSIVALMAGYLEHDGYTVLILDTDESNPGLCQMLGLSKEPIALSTLLTRVKEQARLSDEWLESNEIALKNIPAEYIASDKNQKFMMLGKIKDPFQGCACSMADIARTFVQKLVLEDKEIILIDMEAGIESFGRGVERGVDTVLIVVEPSAQSIALAEKIHFMAQGMGIQRINAILNKIPSSEIGGQVKSKLEGKGIHVISSISYNSCIFQACLEGRSINGKPITEIADIVKFLLANAD